MPANQEGSSLLGIIRLLRVAGWVVLIVLASYLALAGYSAVTLTPNGNGSAQYSLLPDGAITIVTTINLSNPGYFAFTGLSIASAITLPNGTAPWLESSSPSVTLPAHGLVQVPLRFDLSLTSLGSARALLTQDEILNESDYVNGTYATFVGFALHAGERLNWGAPFHAFRASVGTPVMEANGTLGVPVTLSFDNDASFSIPGVLLASLSSANGTACAHETMPIQDAPHSSTSSATTFYLPSDCSLAGGSLATTFVAPGFDVALPSEAIP
jgi:hypothetical protein